MALPENRVPIAKMLATDGATPLAIGRALGMTESAVSETLEWHFDRGNIERAGSVWRLTPDGREWLRERTAETKVRPTKKPKKAEVKPAGKSRPANATSVRERLTEAGLWAFVENFASANGVNAMALVSEARTQHLGRTRLRLYSALLSYPGRSYSASEVAYLCGRYHGTVRDGLASLRARENKAA